MLEQQDSVLALLILAGCALAIRSDLPSRTGFLSAWACLSSRSSSRLPSCAHSATHVYSESWPWHVCWSPLSPSFGGPILDAVLRQVRPPDGTGLICCGQRKIPDGPSRNATIRGLIFEVGRSADALSSNQSRVVPISYALASLALLGWGCQMTRKSKDKTTASCLALLLSLLLSFHLLMHDLVLLAIPAALLRKSISRFALAIFYIALLQFLFYPNSQSYWR